MSSERVQFGPFVLDAGRYELTRAGKPLRLERIPMDLLILLVREQGRLISREEIIERLWGKNLYFDTDNSINTAIRKIRHSLGDAAGNPQYVETVLGKGYRFKGLPGIGPIVELAQIERSRIMLAVLPFENLSGDPAQEYFSDGLSEETIMRLGQMSPRRLGVIARTSSMAYKQSDKSVAQIGRELGVDYVLEGSVRREGARVRITAQLIRVPDQIHLWAENYDRQLPGILDIHGEIGAAIADQVKLELMAEEKRQLTRNAPQDPEAHDHYLRGRYHYVRFNLFDAQKAAAYFQQARERDPSFGLAHSGLADALMVFPLSGDVATNEVSSTTKSAIEQALRLDPESAEAHTSDASMKFWFDWDFKGSELACRRAIQLNENYSLAHVYLAHVCSNTGRYDEALAAIQQATVLDPLSLFVGAMRGQFLYHAGRDSESVQQFNATLGMESRFWIGQICAAKVYEKLGMYSEALVACERALEFSGGNSEALSIAGYVHAVGGDRAKAEGYIQQMVERKRERYVPPYNVALVFAGLGEHESALYWLGEAVEERDVHMPFLLDHKWDVMRSNSRFREIAARVGFTEPREDSLSGSSRARG
jgi:TolB-like protein/DNA-binding winged helix-turn-helix (wHTH) protein/Flp pilus assembly protein TadD